jgi:D-glycero-D-manno-heptose 1,7-bisphosphate phosphatase
MARLILLDRDGVINFDSPSYVKSPEEWIPIPGALDAIADLKHAGWRVAVCSNQSGVGRGLFTLDALDAIHAKLASALAERSVRLDALRFCPHLPGAGCRCRKPAPGMLIDAMQALGAAPERTIAIGDSVRDVEAARAAGCRAILVRTGNGTADESAARRLGVVAVYDDLRAAADALIGDGAC